MTINQLAVALRSDDEVARKMAPSADKMEPNDFVDAHADFIINRVLITRDQAEQVCLKLWRYYRT